MSENRSIYNTESTSREVGKLAAVRALGLTANLFADASEKLVGACRARAARSYPLDLRKSPLPVRLTLLVALRWRRPSEITDSLVDLLIALILKVSTRADKRVERELTGDLRRVRGKEGILLRLAAAAVEQPDELVRTVLYLVVGEKRCGELCHAGGPGMRPPGHPTRACAAPSGDLGALGPVNSGLL